MRFGQGDIGGINACTAIHVTDQHAHGNGNVGDGNVACAIGHVHKRNRDSLDVGHAIEIDGDLRRPVPAEIGHMPSTRSHHRAPDRDRAREVNDHLIRRAGAAFDSHVAGEWQRDIESTGSAVHLSRERALRHRSRRDIDRTRHAEPAVGGTEVGVSASLGKGVLINRANV